MDQDVFQRNLVVENPKSQDILRESSQYFQDTKRRNLKADVLGYITPVSNFGSVAIEYGLTIFFCRV